MVIKRVAHQAIEDYVVTPDIADENMPKVIKRIIKEEQQRQQDDTTTDLWTPAVEARYQEQVSQLAGKYRKCKKISSLLINIHLLAQLAEAMETAISAEFRIAKPSELIKMVGVLWRVHSTFTLLTMLS